MKPIKVEVKVPAIGSKVEGEYVALFVRNLKSGKMVQEVDLVDGKMFRENFYL